MKAGLATRCILSLVVIAMTAAPGSAQQDDGDWLRNCERQAQRSNRAAACIVRPTTTQLAAGGLSVDAGRNGGISVRGERRSDVQVSARIQAQADTDVRARELADAVRIYTTEGRVYADGLRTNSGESWTVSFFIVVPERVDLDLTAVNGPLAISSVSGQIRAVTVNGPVALDDLSGDVRVRADNGPLSVRLSGSRWNGAGLDAETRNGPVTMQLPDGYSAQLEAGTVNGPFSTRIPLTVQGDLRRGGHVRTTLGSGGAPVRVMTTNGPVTIGSR
jgi:DUF4097 and DUF4098 domain-containing protein YvlB